MAAPILESAIPQHLQTQRTCPARLPNHEYEPPFPAYCARFPSSVQDIVMAIIGAQHRAKEAANEARALDQILTFIRKETEAPKHYDLASVTDATGFYNEVVIAYWDDQQKYNTWKSTSGFDQWWNSLDLTRAQHGWFQEVFTPSMDRVETLYSDLQPGKSPEAHGSMSTELSGAIREHVYWGSMRDRLAVSQTDELLGEQPASEEASTDTEKSRVKLPGKQNLCVICSGQDWSKTNLDERKLYLETMHPVLIEGMNFLRDHGDEVGCYSCRFMDVLESKSENPGTDRTFGLAYFDDIASLEKWSKEHTTHLNIFGGFLQYAKKLNFNVTLHLYHEVFVLKPEQQFFEYIGCQRGTGMLNNLLRS